MKMKNKSEESLEIQQSKVRRDRLRDQFLLGKVRSVFPKVLRDTREGKIWKKKIHKIKVESKQEMKKRILG